MRQLKYKATTINKDWLLENNFFYRKSMSDETDSVYTHRFPVCKYSSIPTLEAEMNLRISYATVSIDVYDGNGWTRGIYAPFYREDESYTDFIDQIMKQINKECEKLGLIEIGNDNNG
jgi:hypothetical protein